MNQINTIDDILDISEKLLLEKLDCSEDDRFEIEMIVIPSYREKLLGIIQETLQIGDNEDLTIKLLNQNTRLSLCATLERAINPDDFKISKDIMNHVRSETMQVIQEQGKENLKNAIREKLISPDPKYPEKNDYSKLADFINNGFSDALKNFKINEMGLRAICINLGIEIDGQVKQDQFEEILRIVFTEEELKLAEELNKNNLISSIRNALIIQDPEDPEKKDYSKLADLIKKGLKDAMHNFKINGMGLQAICISIGIKVGRNVKQEHFDEMLRIVFTEEELKLAEELNKNNLKTSIRNALIIQDPDNPEKKVYSKLADLINKGLEYAKKNFKINGLGLYAICNNLGIKIDRQVKEEHFVEMLRIVFTLEELKQAGFKEKGSFKEELIKSIRDSLLIRDPDEPDKKDYSKLADLIKKGLKDAMHNFKINGLGLYAVCISLGIKVGKAVNQDNFDEMLIIIFTPEELKLAEELNKNNLISSIRNALIIQDPKDPEKKDYSELADLINKGFYYAKQNFKINGLGLQAICIRLGIQVDGNVKQEHFEEMLRIVFTHEELKLAEELNKNNLISSIRNALIIQDSEDPEKKVYSELTNLINKGFYYAKQNFKINGLGLYAVCISLGIQVGKAVNQDNFDEMLRIVFTPEELKLAEELNKNNLISSIRNSLIIQDPDNPEKKNYSDLANLINKGFEYAKKNFKINGMRLQAICKNLGIKVGKHLNQANFEEMLIIVFTPEELKLVEELNKNNLISSIRNSLVIQDPEDPEKKDYSKLANLISKGCEYAKKNFKINGMGLQAICISIGIKVGRNVKQEHFDEMLRIVFTPEELKDLLPPIYPELEYIPSEISNIDSLLESATKIYLEKSTISDEEKKFELEYFVIPSLQEKIKNIISEEIGNFEDKDHFLSKMSDSVILNKICRRLDKIDWSNFGEDKKVIDTLRNSFRRIILLKNYESN